MGTAKFFWSDAFPLFEEVAEIIGIVVADVHRNGGQLIIRPGQQLLGMLQAALGQKVDESLSQRLREDGAEMRRTQVYGIGYDIQGDIRIGKVLLDECQGLLDDALILHHGGVDVGRHQKSQQLFDDLGILRGIGSHCRQLVKVIHFFKQRLLRTGLLFLDKMAQLGQHEKAEEAVPICIAIGAIIGAWQGYWVAYFGIPAFIVTLAGLLMFRGLTQVVLGGQSLAPFPEIFQKISTGYLPDLTDGSVHLLTMILGVLIAAALVFGQWRTREKRKNNLFEVESMNAFTLKAVMTAVVMIGVTYIFASYQGYPVILVILGVIVVAYAFLTNKTVAGRQIYATGGNRKAAELSGIKTKKIAFWVFVNMGAMAALAGLILAARLNAATPQAGTSMELDAMAAVYFGGASTSGGIGTIVGTIVGGLVMGVLNNGMSILGVGVDWQQAIKGLILLLAVVLDIYNKKKKAA